MKPFREWLLNRAGLPLPIGDLATDILADPYFPVTNNMEIMAKYMLKEDYPKRAIQCLRNSHARYLKESKQR